MRAALDNGTFSPVIFAEITTAVLDAPPAQQTKTYYRTIEGADGVELLYPAQPGDPQQTATLAYQGFGGTTGAAIRVVSPLDGGTRNGVPVDAIYQTFSMGDSIGQAARLKQLKVQLRRTDPVAAGWQIKARLFRVAGDQLVDLAVTPQRYIYNLDHVFAGGVESSTVIDPATLTIDANTTITFVFDQLLIPGVRYALLLYPSYTGGIVPNPVKMSVYWMGSHAIVNRAEWSGSVRRFRDADESTRFNSERSLEIVVATYSYDGATNSWVEVSIDLNGTPVSEGYISLRDARPIWIDPITKARQTTDIAYTLWSGNSPGAKDIALGTVVDGSKIATLRRYYVLRAELRTANTTTLIRTPIFKEVNLSFPQVVSGAAKTYAFSSHPFPFTLAPAIEKAPSLPTKLDPRNHLSMRGGFSLSLIDLNGEVARIATEEHLINLPVEVRVGNLSDATSKEDLLLIGQGIVTDYEYEEGRLVLQVEDRTKNLAVKVPKPQQGEIQRRDYSYKELVDVLESLIADEAQISRRWIDTSSFSALKTYLKGSDALNKYITHRVLTEPTEARELINEILQLLGAYLVVREDGVMTLIQYPRSGNAVAAWDGSILSADDRQPAGLARSIINQCIVLYDANGNGGNEGAVVSVDATAQDAWAPGAELFVADRLVKSGWLGPEAQFFGKTLAERIGQREIKAKSNGMVPYQGRTALNQIEVQVGDFVNVTSPAFLRKNELGMTGKKMMILSKAPRWDDEIIDWELMEVIDANRRPTASFTATPEEGAPSLVVNFNGSGSVDPDGTIITYEWDFDYDGVNFTVDATGVTTSHTYNSTAVGTKQAALRVTDNNGAQHLTTKLIRVFAAPVAVIHYDISAPDQPLFAVLSSGSYGVTAQIVKTEWDLSYDGVTFNSEVRGQTATTINLPYQNVTVALRVTDADGQTATATLILTGKAFAPADVTGFFIDQNGDKLTFKWNVNPDTDIFGYEIRKGSAWNLSTLVADEILTNSFMTVAPTVAGTYTYLIKAINSTGRRSINAISITMTVFDTKDRNVLVTADRKATGWPGTKTGLVYETAGDRWWIDATGDQVQNATGQVSAATGQIVLRGTRTSGTYEGSPVDLGGIVNGNRLSISISTELAPDPEGVSAKTEYAESDDGVGYSAFAQISQGDLGFQYVKEKITLSNDDGTSNIALQDVDVIIDVPDVSDDGNDVTVPVGGATINFNRTFNTIPTIGSITIQNVTTGHFAEIPNAQKTKTGFFVRIRRTSDGADVGGLIDWTATGY